MWGLPCLFCHQKSGALLPHLFTLAVVLAHAWAVYFLLHFPWARAPQALPGAVPCGARTFLRFLAKTAIAWPTPADTIEGPGSGLKSRRRAVFSRARAPARRRRSCARRSASQWLPQPPMRAGTRAAPRAFHRAARHPARLPPRLRR